ncbi:helix-turn-helix domain-containing protein [candidate division WOR-3 bacterium]|nr:helix-turn-helix domain-containing protein [candidate division WOR-3 bacterium]
MARTRERLGLPVELCRKLRELRLGAGLELDEFVRRLGRNKGYRSNISRLERGKLGRVSARLLLDYLSVCRVTREELVGLLYDHVSRGSPLEARGKEQVRAFTEQMPASVAKKLHYYDIKTTIWRRFAGEPPLAPDERELRVRKQARAWLEQGRVDNDIQEHMDDLGVVSVLGVRRFAFSYGHKVWRILKQTRPRPGIVERPSRRRKTREQRLEEAEAKALAMGTLPVEGLRLIRYKVMKRFAQMERDGELDYLPSLAEAHNIEKPLSARFKRRHAGPSAPRVDSPYDFTLFATIVVNTGTRMTAAGIEGQTFFRYFRWLPTLLPIALETLPGTDERERRVAAEVARSRDPAFTRRVADMYFAEFELWRDRVFRRPRPKSDAAAPDTDPAATT